MDDDEQRRREFWAFVRETSRRVEAEWPAWKRAMMDAIVSPEQPTTTQESAVIASAEDAERLFGADSFVAEQIRNSGPAIVLPADETTKESFRAAYAKRWHEVARRKLMRCRALECLNQDLVRRENRTRTTLQAELDQLRRDYDHLRKACQRTGLALNTAKASHEEAAQERDALRTALQRARRWVRENGEHVGTCRDAPLTEPCTCGYAEVGGFLNG